MSRKSIFEERYQTGNTPWELDRPDKHLQTLVKEYPVTAGKALDIGCGTGSNVLWLANQGFDVTGVDFSHKAIELATEKIGASSEMIRFRVMDFLKDDVIDSDFTFVFDRGCFHSFDDEKDRRQFAEKVSRHLKTGGLWFSNLGSCDSEPSVDGPPRRSALDIVTAVEAFFEIGFIRADRFDSSRELPAKCWLCLMKKRSE